MSGSGADVAASPAVRRTTVAAVLLVACVAAVVSYAHMQHVAHREGEAWRSFLLPLSVDGLMVAASMVLLARRRAGLSGGALPWTALLAGVGASLAANVAAAEPTTAARIVAAWPAVAFAVAFELLLQQRGPTDTGITVVAPTAPPHRADGGADTHDPTADPRRRLRNLPSRFRPTTEIEPGAAGDDAALVARATQLLAQADGHPPGRRALARELGCTEHRARVLLDALAPNGTTPTDQAPHDQTLIEGSDPS